MGEVIHIDFDKKYRVKFRTNGQILFTKYDGPMKVENDIVTVYVRAFGIPHAEKIVKELFNVTEIIR